MKSCFILQTSEFTEDMSGKNSKKKGHYEHEGLITLKKQAGEKQEKTERKQN